MNNKVAVLGDGSWGTAMVKILTERGMDVNWWVRKEEAVQFIKERGHNRNYLSSVKLNLNLVSPDSSVESCIKKSDYILICIPATYIVSSLQDVRPEHFVGKKVISSVKGMVAETNQLVTEWLSSEFNVSEMDLAVVAGPCHAEELAMDKQSYLTIASQNPELGNKVVDLLNVRYVSATVVQDVLGVEYAAVLKNVVAMACGITHGMNMGDNFQAVMVSNAMQEIKRFLNKLNSSERDLDASAYLGDLLVTAYSQYSRNRTFGNMIGRGYEVKTAKLEMGMVAEGYYAVESIIKLNQQLGVEMPICQMVYNILYLGNSRKEEVKSLAEKLV